MIWNNSRRWAFACPWTAGSWALMTTIWLAGVLSPISVRAAADAAAGERIYRTRCVGCHGDGKTAGTIGPSLIGIVGRKAATGESGVHSRALIASDIVWDEASLRKFLAAPTKAVPGTNMPARITDPRELDDLVAYLLTLR